MHFKKTTPTFIAMHTKSFDQVSIVIDFDSTFTKVEGLDELANIALAGKREREETVRAIRELTDLGMAGELALSESLRRRVALLQANQLHIDELVAFLFTKISDSFLRNKAFLTQYSDQIYIVSSGFKEFIVPIVASMGIKPQNVYANTFVFDEAGNIIGLDQTNVLAHDKGKVKLLEALKLPGEVYVIGDGYTDYEIKEAGLATRFYAFTENVERPKVMALAERRSASLDEFLFDNQLSRSQSYPKSRIKVLLLENVHPDAVQLFDEDGFTVETVKGALDEDELAERIRDVSILGIRSKTNVTKKVLENAPKLISIGAFCIGTNQIDLKTCTEKGIAVFNAPYSNTRSVVELAVGEMIMLIRNVFSKSEAMHAGKWDKSAASSFEVRGKKLGIIGYGNIGTQLSNVAEALGMEVHFYDVLDKMPYSNARKHRKIEEVLAIADVLTVHVDGRKENDNLIGEREFALMKNGVVFLNLARGKVVNIAALVAAIKSGKVAGAGVDVFPYEPKTNKETFINDLRGLPNVILTPHIGGSTEEAQAAIGHFVPNKLLEYINNGSTYGSVNLPEQQLPPLRNSHRLLHIHRNVPGMLAQLNGILAKYHVNIAGQYLQTNDTVGYVIMDISETYSDSFVQEIRNIEGTIRLRMLY